VPHASVSIVYVVYNRREELRESLQRMLFESDYAGEVEVIVVDNASQDGSAAMVREEFPQVKVIEQAENIGAPAWNDGYFAAKNDWVLTLDDDAYLPPDGLTRAIEAAARHDAHLVSFKVASTHDPDHVFSDKYRTGLFSFWGCSWIVRREVLQELGGYDPEIFMWANELELMIRFLDRGYRHLHFPEVVGQHMKRPGTAGDDDIEERGYRINAERFGYIAGKLLQPRDAAEALIALLARDVRDGLRVNRVAFKALPDTLRGFAKGLRLRQPVRPEVSSFYRRNFETFASPWWTARPLGELLRALPRETIRELRGQGRRPTGLGRREQWYEERARLYPNEPRVLQL
jgi:GT2 family glycosyltransferase